ncbi:universal stress protein [Streptomyces sp. L7]
MTVGVDARDPSGGALGFAFEAARLHGVRLHAVHAWALPASAAASLLPLSEQERAAREDHEEDLLSDALRPWRAASTRTSRSGRTCCCSRLPRPWPTPPRRPGWW